MKFWDSSALVPLFAAERRTRAVQSLYLSDPEVIVWSGTAVECASAIARLERDGALAPPDAAESFARLESVAAPGRDEVEGRAARLQRQGVLRPALSPAPRRVLTTLPPKPHATATLSDAVIAERRQGR